MKLKFGFFILFFLLLDFILILYILLHGTNIAILNPEGLIAHQQKNLMFTAVSLMLLIAIPVIVFIYTVAWKYRAQDTKRKYTPDWDHSTKLQLMIWGILLAVILILSAINWKTAHALDPHKELASNVKPIEIQVVALRWKWLFIYPEQKIATVNFVAFPEKTPLNFKLTSDAPINSFWIPQLGGQMYAMTGMVTPLHLIADRTGEYSGSTAELSGAGFAGMRFVAKSMTANDFEKWVASVKANPQILDLNIYNELAKPSENNPQQFFGSTEDDLYNKIINKFLSK